VSLLLAAVLVGCASPHQAPDRSLPEINPRPSGQELSLTLYFPAPGGQWLELEERRVTRLGEPLADLVLRELLRGPETSGRVSLLPAGLTASVEVREETAYVSLAKAVENLAPAHTRIQLQALVNSLTEVEGIKDVQFLIEGKQQFSLGLIYIGEPWGRTLNLVARPGFRPIVECDPRQGELFIEGEVLEVRATEQLIVIEQHLQDARTVMVDPAIKLDAGVVLHLQGEDFEETEIELSGVKRGDAVGIILTREHKARAVIVSRRRP
jgi:hypothetical protein